MWRIEMQTCRLRNYREEKNKNNQGKFLRTKNKGLKVELSYILSNKRNRGIL
jgi:hypothetical protein